MMTRFEKLLERSRVDLTEGQENIIKKELKGMSYSKDDYLKILLDESTTDDNRGRQNIYRVYLTKELDNDKFNDCDRYICTM
jgi:hypothetical protein